MIELPIWIFVILCVWSGFFLLLLIGDFILFLVEKIKNKVNSFIKWKAKYEQYKSFWEENSELREDNEEN